MRNEIATTNDRPYKLVKPKKLPCGRCRLASVLRAGHNTNLGLVVTRRPDASWKRYGDVAVDARGPEICKTWKPLRSTSTHCEGRNAARGSIALPQAATMSSWMKTLQSGANKVGTAPRINQTPRHGRDAGSMARTSQRARLLTAIT